MADPIDMPDDPALLAAELALGVLEGEALVAAKRRMLTDPAFAAEVEDWRARLAAIGLDASDAIPSDDLWARIERSIDTGTGTSVADLVPRRALRRWQWGTAAAGSVAAALAVLLAIPRSEPVAPAPVQVAVQPAIVAQLRGEGEGPLVAARYDPATAQLRLVAHDMGDDPRVPELWIIPADGIPRSLGVIQPVGNTQLVVAEGHRSMLHDGATLAITMEPRDTAPHAAPTGPRVAAGKIFGI